jgi:hypothetical protein
MTLSTQNKIPLVRINTQIKIFNSLSLIIKTKPGSYTEAHGGGTAGKEMQPDRTCSFARLFKSMSNML